MDDDQTSKAKSKTDRVKEKPTAEDVRATVQRTAKDLKDVLDRLADK